MGDIKRPHGVVTQTFEYETSPQTVKPSYVLFVNFDGTKRNNVTYLSTVTALTATM